LVSKIEINVSQNNNDEGIAIAEFTNEEGSIIRVRIRKGIISKTISSCRHVDKFVTDKDIENIYIKTKDAFEKRMKSKSATYRKFCGNFMEFEDFKELMIYKYKLVGIEYRDIKELRLM
jgi:hypothetical protein